MNPDGRRYWRLSFRFAGKQKALALGTYPTVSLAEARKRRDVIKQQLADGIAPSVARQLAHDERNEVRGAYNSAQYLAGRRQMMRDWADYLDRAAVG